MLSAMAQENGNPTPNTKDNTKNTPKGKCARLYLGTGTGINNSAGVLGITVDVPVASSVSVEAGAGLSTWGSKVTVGGKFYFKPCYRGWAIGTGITHNTGLDAFSSDMETVNGGKEKVTLKLKPQTNMYLAAYSYVKLGKKMNRFHSMFGWSIPLSTDRYEQTYGAPISSTAKKALDIIKPGGLVVGIGFSFAIGN